MICCVQNGMNGMQEVITCNVSSSTGDQSSACGSGYVCAPLPSADIRASGNAAHSASAWGLAPAANPMQGAPPSQTLIREVLEGKHHHRSIYGRQYRSPQDKK